MKPSLEISLSRLAQQWIGNVLLLGGFLFLFIGLLDYIITPENFRTFLKVRLVMSGILLGLFGLNRLRRSIAYQYGIILASATLSAVAVEFMVLRLGGAQSAYYAGFILVVICCIGFVPLNLIQSAGLLAVVYAIYLIPITNLQVLTDPIFVNNNIFLFSVCIIMLALRWQNQKRIINELTLMDALERQKQTLQQYAGEMKEQNEEMKSFAYIVSHDLRAPLVSIKGFSQELAASVKDIDALLEKALAGLDPDVRRKLESLLRVDIHEAVTFIGSSVSRMDGLITNVLTLSRLGRRELKPEPVDMHTVIRSLLDALAHQIAERRVQVTVGSLPVVMADRTAMEQIMGNLLDNAVKYLQPDRTGLLEITADQGPAETTIRVRDNGRGMRPEDIPKAFEIFQRVGTRDVPGEGMGLAYVKTLVRRHGGRIWCESEPGQGTTFSFTVPRDGEPA